MSRSGEQYLTVGGSRFGTMNCGACGKDITEGDYRVYQKSGGHDWHYVTHHRACCADDPNWEKRDRHAAKHDRTLVEIEISIKALFARFPATYHGVIAEEVETYFEASQ